jgi:hypothetical protein
MFQRAQLNPNSQRHFLYRVANLGIKKMRPPTFTCNKKKALTLVWGDKSTVQGGRNMNYPSERGCLSGGWAKHSQIPYASVLHVQHLTN